MMRETIGEKGEWQRSRWRIMLRRKGTTMEGVPPKVVHAGRKNTTLEKAAT